MRGEQTGRRREGVPHPNVLPSLFVLSSLKQFQDWSNVGAGGALSLHTEELV